MPTFTLLRGGHLYAPENRGKVDILLCGERIACLQPFIDPKGLPGDVTVENLDEHLIVPGLIDGHLHLVGGGGSEGYGSRIPELWLSDISIHGITTVVGAPGLDTISKPIEAILAKACALENDGLSAYVYSGGFLRPLATVTASLIGDVYAIPKVLGVKIALGDSRAPCYSDEELLEIASQIHWAACATGKEAVVHAHLGLLPKSGDQLFHVIDRGHVPSRRFVATHCNYTEDTGQAALKIGCLGAWVDVTTILDPARGIATATKASAAIRSLRDGGVPLSQICMSSDGNGSVPRIVSGNKRASFETNMDTLTDELFDLVREEGFSLSDALSVVTINVARALGLANHKGSIDVGKDGDLMILDRDFRINSVYARGRRLVANGSPIAFSMFETKNSL